MRKIIRRVLLVIGAILILLVGFGLFNYYPILAMNPAGTGKIQNTNIYAVRFSIGTVYLIKTDSGYLLFDTGTDGGKLIFNSENKKLEESLKEKGIEANDVKWIFLTHSDFDHVAGLTLFPNATIYMNEDELPLINGMMNRSKYGGNNMPTGININEIILLSDAQELSFGGTNIVCIKAPGHTPGSMLYMVDGKYLFTGDAFMLKNRKMKVHISTMDVERSKKTIEQLEDRVKNISIVLTSHYGVHFFNNVN
jgi:glyoxylase-like metal-dependent hydrolase (beta-lactamase superfamily II)